MIKKIANLLRGSRPTLLETEKANEIINCLNSLQNINIIESNETRVDVGQNGITIMVNVPKPKPLPRVKIKAEPPIVIKQIDNYEFEIFLEGFTRNIKYCGGEGDILHLAEKYDSSEIHDEDFAQNP